ncbi:MAG TPA: HAD family phosphatase [Ideonella sp.]|nr:HAD family phosphatase [Ideonella sp.]
MSDSGAAVPQRHIIFDFGGVLFDWRPAALLAEVLPDRAPTDDLAEHWKAQFFQGYEGEWGAFDSGLIEVHDLVTGIAARTGLSEDEVQRVIDAVPPALQPLPATVALLQRLKEAGHRLFFLSNMPAPYADYLEQNHPELLGHFEDGVFSARVKVGKPKPEIFDIALRQFGVEAEHGLFIDDHPANVDAAHALGLPAHLFTSASGLEAALVERGLLVA